MNDDQEMLEANGVVSARTATEALSILFSGKTTLGCAPGHHWGVVSTQDEITKDVEPDPFGRFAIEMGSRRRKLTIELIEFPAPGTTKITIRRLT